jgi:hypothetical protein
MVRALLPKPPRKGTPPPADNTVGILTKAPPNELTPMNFKVPAEFHREFKAYAALRGISMLELLQESFRLVKLHQGQ